MKINRLTRGALLVKSGLKALSREISGSDKFQKRLDQIGDIVSALSELKGAAMKAGQWVSLEFSDYFPSEVVDLLRKLQDDSTPIPIEDIKKILNQQLKEKAQEILEHLSTQPIAAASIGQVHRSTYKKQDVAIKVQFPGVAQSIDSDLFILRKIFNLACKVRGVKVNLDPLFVELKKELKKETNYILEKKNMIQYLDMMQKYSEFKVPKPIEQLCTRRILVTELSHGVKLKDWLKLDHSKPVRQEIGQNFLKLVLLEFFVNRYVQTDANYGNFLIEDRKIVLLDFGSCKKISQVFLKKMIRLLKATLDGSEELILSLSQDLELLDEKESEETKEKYLKMMRAIGGIFLPQNQPWEFGDSDFHQKMQKMAREFILSVKFTPPARNFVFLNRKLGGIYLLLKELDADINVNELWEKYSKVD